MVIATLLATATGYILNGIKNSKGLENATNDFSVAFWNWIKPIFIESDKILVEQIEEGPIEEAKPLIKALFTKKESDNNFINELQEKINQYEKNNPPYLIKIGKDNSGIINVLTDSHGNSITISQGVKETKI